MAGERADDLEPLVEDLAHERVERDSTKAPRQLWPPAALRAWLDGYHEMGTVERVVPLAFAGIYVAELIRQATS